MDRGVIITGDDGGLRKFLIGMQRHETALFSGMIWSTSIGDGGTRRRLAGIGLPWREAGANGGCGPWPRRSRRVRAQDCEGDAVSDVGWATRATQ